MLPWKQSNRELWSFSNRTTVRNKSSKAAITLTFDLPCEAIAALFHIDSIVSSYNEDIAELCINVIKRALNVQLFGWCDAGHELL